MKKILVTTDFSTKSKAGIRFAIQLAAQKTCLLIFYNVIELSDINVATDRGYSEVSVLDGEIRQEKLMKFVLKIYKQVGKTPGRVDWIIDNKPNVDGAIIAFAQKCKADYICMGTRGGGIADKFLGTNASGLITSSPVPVIVVPHTYRIKPLKSILYASDLENIRREIIFVEDFSTTFDANIAIYHYDYFLEKTEAVIKLNKKAEKYSSENVVFHFRKLYAELSLLTHLQNDIRRSRPSIIVMFTKQNRTWFERLFISSKTAELGFDTKTPLLVFRK